MGWDLPWPIPIPTHHVIPLRWRGSDLSIPRNRPTWIGHRVVSAEPNRILMFNSFDSFHMLGRGPLNLSCWFLRCRPMLWLPSQQRNERFREVFRCTFVWSQQLEDNIWNKWMFSCWIEEYWLRTHEFVPLFCPGNVLLFSGGNRLLSYRDIVQRACHFHPNDPVLIPPIERTE